MMFRMIFIFLSPPSNQLHEVLHVDRKTLFFKKFAEVKNKN